MGLDDDQLSGQFRENPLDVVTHFHCRSSLVDRVTDGAVAALAARSYRLFELLTASLVFLLIMFVMAMARYTLAFPSPTARNRPFKVGF
jgi:hypothetical protein